VTVDVGSPAAPAPPGEPAPPLDDEAPPTRGRHPNWGALSGVVILVYLVVWAATLSRIANRVTYNRWGDAMGSLGARFVLCVVVLAGLFHTFDGVRRLLVSLAPRLAGREQQLRAAVLFLTWATAIPCAAAIVWPWIAETTR
jgi:succinate dehydrogenase/fumarate reductase cytochrome b subunit